jgi:hypothetical protein
MKTMGYEDGKAIVRGPDHLWFSVVKADMPTYSAALFPASAVGDNAIFELGDWHGTARDVTA